MSAANANSDSNRSIWMLILMKAAKITGVVQGGKGASSQDEQQPRAAEVSQEDTQTGDLFTA